MKIEFKILIYSMINNFVISTIKIAGGIILGLGSLMADGLHTFCDFTTDIICMIGSKISKKKPTKYHPFGYGKFEYLTNQFIGVILFLLGVFIIVNGFGGEHVIPPLSILWLLVAAIILKVINILIMHIVGKKINSQVLIQNVEESSTDLVSSIAVIIITILLQFSNKYPILKYADLIGSILIGIIVLKISFKIIVENSLLLIGETEDNKEEIKKISDFLDKYHSIKDKDIKLIKYGNYYKLQLELELDSSLTLHQVTVLENKIKKDITRHYSLDIKHVTIYVTDQLDRD